MEQISSRLKKAPAAWTSLVIGVVCTVSGVIGLLLPASRMNSFVVVIGIALCIFGMCNVILGIITRSVRHFCAVSVAEGVIAIAMGILAFCFTDLLAKYLPTLLGFTMIVIGIVQCPRSMLLGRRGWKQWWIGVTVAVLLFAVGLFILLDPSLSGKIIGVALGLASIASGVSNLAAFVSVIMKKEN
ncbi:MAG: DUF308 domain-containing protein [Clostridia bacterium]|nr:DUF308 domain-containing protein [Clostridia bacterium]